MYLKVYLDPVGQGYLGLDTKVSPYGLAQLVRAAEVLSREVTGHVKVVPAGLPHQHGTRYLCVERCLVKPQDTEASQLLYSRPVPNKVQAIDYAVLFEGNRVGKPFGLETTHLVAILSQLCESTKVVF